MGAAAEQLHNSVDLLCVTLNGRRATQLDRFTLCGTAAAELHNSVDLLCVAQRLPSYTTW